MVIVVCIDIPVIRKHKQIPDILLRIQQGIHGKLHVFVGLVSLVIPDVLFIRHHILQLAVPRKPKQRLVDALKLRVQIFLHLTGKLFVILIRHIDKTHGCNMIDIPPPSAAQ